MVGMGRDPYSDEFTYATLSHSLWLHRVPRVDQWLLCQQHCTAVGCGRALIHGRLTDEHGRLVASYSQEGGMWANSQTNTPAEGAA